MTTILGTSTPLEPGGAHDAIAHRWVTTPQERRERIATAVLAGIASNSDDQFARLSYIDSAEWAVRYADALIEALDE